MWLEEKHTEETHTAALKRKETQIMWLEETHTTVFLKRKETQIMWLEETHTTVFLKRKETQIMWLEEQCRRDAYNSVSQEDLFAQGAL